MISKRLFRILSITMAAASGLSTKIYLIDSEPTHAGVAVGFGLLSIITAIWGRE